MKLSFRKRLKRFMIFAGEPANDVKRDNVILIISIIFMLLLGMVFCFGDSKILAMLGYDKGIVRLIVMVTLFGFSYAMLLCWLILVNKRLWSELDKNVTTKECWMIIKILFVLVFLFLIVKDCILYVLGNPKQRKVTNHLTEIAIAYLLSGLLIPVEFFFVTQCLVPVCSFLKISVNEEIVCLVIVILAIGLFFLFSEKFSHLSILWEVQSNMKNELKQRKIKNVDDIFKRKPIKRKIEFIKNRECKEFDEQFKQTKLLVYVVLVFFILVIPKDSMSAYENMFVEQIMGVATLAALLREVKAA